MGCNDLELQHFWGIAGPPFTRHCSPLQQLNYVLLVETMKTFQFLHCS